MRFWASISSALLVCAAGSAQTAGPVATPPAKHRRANELTLAGLRPGRDTASLAVRLYSKQRIKDSSEDGQVVFAEPCGFETLTIDTDAEKKIQVVRVMQAAPRSVPITMICEEVIPAPWRTGRGLRFWDPAPRVVQLYGEPDSRSPSTKDGRKLELLYYAFDWAGVDVPQVMEVLCTVEDDGKPGRVVEITLAAPSL